MIPFYDCIEGLGGHAGLPLTFTRNIYLALTGVLAIMKNGSEAS